MKTQAKFAVAVILLAVTALFLHARSRNEVLPPREPLAGFPRQLADWTSQDVTIPDDQREVLGAGDFMLRVYQKQTVREPYVDLFIAYFPSQRAGDTIHSPKNCLPGSGWSPIESGRMTVTLPGHEPFPANRYVIAKGSERQLVLYWYWAHDRAVASEYWAKFYLVTDSMRMHRSDGSLIRLTTPILQHETADAAEQRLRGFAGEIVPHLDTYIPR